jgi:hypothetical protein
VGSADGVGDALMALVARARDAGLDPELELRAAARRFADSVRERERQPTDPEEWLPQKPLKSHIDKAIEYQLYFPLFLYLRPARS